jgi:hypothetical protein
VPGCVASEGRYRSNGIVSPPVLELVDSREGGWLVPDYSAFRIARSSVYFDLSSWKPLDGDRNSASAGRVEPAGYTRVIDVVRKESTDADNSTLKFLFLTGGYDVDLKCATHPHKVSGSSGRELLGAGTEPVLVREIEVDVRREPLGKEFRVVLNGTIWNGFQCNAKGQQWAALLAPDDMSELEIAVKFPPGRIPNHEKAQLSWFLKGDQVGKEPKGTPNFQVESGERPTWWVWRPRDIKKGHVYKITWEWVQPTVSQ